MVRTGGGLIRFGRRPAGEDPASLLAGQLLASLPVPLLALDDRQVVVEANGAAEALLNLSIAAMQGRPIDELIGVPNGSRAMATVPADAPYSFYDVEIASPSGARHRGDLLLAPIPDRPGWRVLTIHVRAPSARRSERQGGNLAAAGAAMLLAHEIKNPLSGIRGAAQLLEASVDADAADLTRLIRDEVDRVAALIDRMESFTDTRPLALEPLNIHSILSHAREVASRGFAASAMIREVYDPSLPPVAGHRDTLVQILLNLIKNAAEAADSQREATITLTTGYRHGVTVATGIGDRRRALPIEVCVIDDGPGPAPAVADHLFDPFVTTKRAGSGLGLALVDKLVGDHGGIVEFAREGTPPRTVFRLLLPRAEEAR